MKLQVGDKVRFLNEAESGWVTKVISNDVVRVEIEDGLEIDVATLELIKVPGSSVESNSTPKKVEKEITIEIDNGPVFEYSKDLKEKLSIDFTRNGNLFDVFFVNGLESDFHLFVFEKVDGTYIFEKDVIVSSNSIIKAFSTSIQDTSGYLIEGIWLNQTGKHKNSPISTVVKVKTARFFKEDSYQPSAIKGRRSISEVIFEEDDLMHQIDVSRLNDFKKVDTSKGPKYSKPHQAPETMEIDLHIEELIDKHKHLTNGEIVNIQLNALEDKINSAIRNNCKELVVIHGVGKGVLRDEVRKLIKNMGFRYSDGSYAKYGYGATLLEFY